jgi:hypothetical protein
MRRKRAILLALAGLSRWSGRAVEHECCQSQLEVKLLDEHLGQLSEGALMVRLDAFQLAV